MVQLLCDRSCYIALLLNALAEQRRDAVSSNGQETAVYDRKLRYHSNSHVKTLQDAMWLIDHGQICGFWETSDAVNGKHSCPNTLGRILFALTSFKQVKVGGPEAVLNRYSCAPAAVEDLEAAQNDRRP